MIAAKRPDASNKQGFFTTLACVVGNIGQRTRVGQFCRRFFAVRQIVEA